MRVEGCMRVGDKGVRGSVRRFKWKCEVRY